MPLTHHQAGQEEGSTVPIFSGDLMEAMVCQRDHGGRLGDKELSGDSKTLEIFGEA